MLASFKKLFSGSTKAAPPVAPSIPDDESWASFEVDPELAYHCRDQGPALAESPAPVAPVDEASIPSGAISATAAAEVILPEFRLMDSESSDSEGPAIELGQPAPAPVVPTAEPEAALESVAPAVASTPVARSARTPAKAKHSPKVTATKARASKPTKPKAAPAKQPKAQARKATIDLRAAWNFNFPEHSTHDDSVETVRLDLAIVQ